MGYKAMLHKVTQHLLRSTKYENPTEALKGPETQKIRLQSRFCQVMAGLLDGRLGRAKSDNSNIRILNVVDDRFWHHGFGSIEFAA